MTIRSLILVVSCVAPARMRAGLVEPAPSAAEAKTFLDNANATTRTLGTQRRRPAGCSRPSSRRHRDDRRAANQAANEAGRNSPASRCSSITSTSRPTNAPAVNLLKVALVLGDAAGMRKSPTAVEIMAGSSPYA